MDQEGRPGHPCTCHGTRPRNPCEAKLHAVLTGCGGTYPCPLYRFDLRRDGSAGRLTTGVQLESKGWSLRTSLFSYLMLPCYKAFIFIEEGIGISIIFRIVGAI